MSLSALVASGQVGNVSNEALAKAMAKAIEQRTESVTTGLVSLMNRFVADASRLNSEAEQAEKEARTSRSVADAAKLALDYLGATGNPLPFFAACCRRDEGAKWCQTNGLQLPDSKSPLWSVPEGWVAPVVAPVQA